MNGTREASTVLATELVAAFEPLSASVDAAVFAPFPYLQHIGSIIRGSGLLLGAQQVSAEANGAFTGQVSAEMLLDVGVQVVIIGHSECRKLLAESDELIGEKVAIKNGYLKEGILHKALTHKDGSKRDCYLYAKTL